MEDATAFQPFQSLQNLQQTACANPSHFNVPVQLTLGLTTLHQGGKGEAHGSVEAPHLAGQTLGDGRLNVGTHMPLLAKRYSYLSVIGEGASAQVILAEDTLRQGGHLVAIKIMKRQYSYAGQKEARALRYMQSRAPECARVVRLLGTFTHAGHMCLVLERLFPSLLDYLSLSATLRPCTRLANLRSVAYQLLGTVAVMHASGVVNADLKPDNVLLRQPPGANPEACPQVVISDFGSAFSETETDTSRLVFEMQTLPYRAPEVAMGLGSSLGTALDVWSLGCILAELALQQPLFPCHSPAQLLKQIEQLLGPLPPQLQRSCGRPGAQPPVGFTAPVKPGTADVRPAGQSALPWLGSFGRSDKPAGAAAFVTGNRRSVTPADMPGQMWHEALSPLGQELAKVDHGLADLVMGMLQLDPKQRLTAATALLHPFFDAVSPMRALMQTSLQPMLSWKSQAPSKEPQPQAQPALAVSHILDQLLEGRPGRHAASPSAALNSAALAMRVGEQAQTFQQAMLAGEPARSVQEDIATLKGVQMGTPPETGRAPALTSSKLVSARLGSLGASGQPAVSPAVAPAQVSHPAAAMSTTRNAAPKLPEGGAQEGAKQERPPVGGIAKRAVASHEGHCSSGSQRGGRGGAAQGTAKRDFAMLEPELPRTLSHRAGYTDTFAFPDADAHISAPREAVTRPSDSGRVEAVAPATAGKAQPRTGAVLAGEEMLQGGMMPDQDQGPAGGNASHSSLSSPGTPGSPDRAAAEPPPPAAAANLAGSQSEGGNGAATDQPAALSSTRGVRLPIAAAAASGPADADCAIDTEVEDDPSFDGAAASLPGAEAASQDARSAPDRGKKDAQLHEQVAVQEKSGVGVKQGRTRGSVRLLVNPSMERARAASGSAGSHSRPPCRDQDGSATVSLETESLPRQPARAAPVQQSADAPRQATAAQGKACAFVNAQATSGLGGAQRVSRKAAHEPGETNGTGSKRRRVSRGDGGESRAKRGRASEIGMAVPQSEPFCLPAMRGAAVAEVSPGNPGMSLNVLAAIASDAVQAAPVHCWPRRMTSAGGMPLKDGSHKGSGAAKRPTSPLIKWPAAADAMPDKRPNTALPRSPGQALRSGVEGGLEQGMPLAGHLLRDRSASARKASKPWWVV